MKFKVTLSTFLSICILLSVYGQEVKVLSWNIESGKNDKDYIAGRLKDFQDYDLIGLSEVDANNKATYDKALGTGFNSVIGNSGRSDRLYIAFNSNRYKLIEQRELEDINIDETVRAPFYAILEDKSTSKQILFMVNHLARGDKRNGTPQRRLLQSQMLNEWVKAIDIPVIAVGDYNYDFQIDANKHNPGLDALLKNQNFFWIYPSNFQRTQCSMSYDPAILDFIFVNRKALILSPTCEIFEHEDNCEKAPLNSDHKAITGIFQM